MGFIKKISTSFILVILSGVFFVTSLIVTLKGEKSAKWVERKMKVGRLMLSLTATLSASEPGRTAAYNDINQPSTCYKVVYSEGEEKPQNVIYLESEDGNPIQLLLQIDNKINGEIRNRTSDTFSFAVFDLQDSAKQRDNINPLNSKSDKETELFEIEIDRMLSAGEYTIRFFLSDKDSQVEWNEQYFGLRVN